MDAVQAPIVPIIGDLIRQTPGTISLGQGVVHYGPPPEAVEPRVPRSRGRQPTSTRTAPACRRCVERIARKLRRRERHRRRARRPDHGDGGRQHGVHARRAGDDQPGRRGDPAGAVLFQPRDGDPDGRLPRRPRADRRVAISCRLDAIARAITQRTRAIVTISPNNPSGAVSSRSRRCARSTTLCRDRGLYHISDETYEYFTYGSARHVSPGSFADAAAHTISLYSLSKAYGFAGWRIGYMVVSGAAARRR